MDSSVEGLIVVILHSFGFGSSESDSSVSLYFFFDCFKRNTLFVSAVLQTILELGQVNLPSTLCLDLCEDEINIGGSELLIQDLSILCKLGEGLTFHFLSLGSVRVEDIVDRAGRFGSSGGNFSLLGALHFFSGFSGGSTEASDRVDGVDSGRSSLAMDSSVKIFVIVELNIVGLRA